MLIRIGGFWGNDALEFARYDKCHFLAVQDSLALLSGLALIRATADGLDAVAEQPRQAKECVMNFRPVLTVALLSLATLSAHSMSANNGAIIGNGGVLSNGATANGATVLNATA